MNSLDNGSSGRDAIAAKFISIFDRRVFVPSATATQGDTENNVSKFYSLCKRRLASYAKSKPESGEWPVSLCQGRECCPFRERGDASNRFPFSLWLLRRRSSGVIRVQTRKLRVDPALHPACCQLKLVAIARQFPGGEVPVDDVSRLATELLDVMPARCRREVCPALGS